MITIRIFNYYNKKTFIFEKFENWIKKSKNELLKKGNYDYILIFPSGESILQFRDNNQIGKLEIFKDVNDSGSIRVWVLILDDEEELAQLLLSLNF